MDGYAVRDADLCGGAVRLRVIGRSFAGAGVDTPLPPGACMRVFTGARVPLNADRVIMQEDVTEEDGVIRLRGAARGKRHIRGAGCDFAQGDVLVAAGETFDAGRLIAAAAADAASVAVYEKPRVFLIGAGDELVAPGRAGQSIDVIPESVTLGAAALVRKWGGAVAGRALVGDRLRDLRAAADEAIAASDIVVVAGGASVGEKDFAKAMFAHLPLEIVVPKVAIKPGKPFWLGRIGEKTIVGLPGNPTAAMVTARLFLAPLLSIARGGAGAAALRFRSEPILHALACGEERETYLRAIAAPHGLRTLADQDSSAQRALARADRLIRRRPGACAAREGDLVDSLDF
jgi:molybdopterin molybdotransferase